MIYLLMLLVLLKLKAPLVMWILFCICGISDIILFYSRDW